MMSFTYLLQVNLYLVLFCIFYLVFLRNETFFKMNRIYLLGSAVLSFLIPVIQSDWARSLFVTEKVKQVKEVINVAVHNSPVMIAQQETESSWGLYQWITLLYFAGIGLFLFRFLWQIAVLYFMAGDDEQKTRAYSFFKRIVISGKLKERETIYNHEKVHVDQWHSADVILMELIAIVNWFNPLIYTYKQIIRHIHEFIADEVAASRLPHKSDYVMILVSNAFGTSPARLTNSFFNQSLLKKRIFMLHKMKSRKAALLKYGLSAPLFAGMLVLSSAVIDSGTPIKAITEKIENVAENSGFAEVTGIAAVKKQVTKNQTTAPLKAVVKDANGRALAGVSIKVKRTGQVVLSGKDGSFTIPKYQSGDVLSLSYKGTITTFDTKAKTGAIPAFYGPFIIKMPAAKLTTAKTVNRPSTLPAPATIEEDNSVPLDFSAIEHAPEYPEGATEMARFIQKNFKWPVEAKSAEVSGKVIASFIVEKNGRLTGIRILRDLGFGTGDEILRVMKLMPAWKPGAQNGRPVRVAFTLPIQLSVGSE